METPTGQINRWIAEHGSCRDALNVALAQLRAAEDKIASLDNIGSFTDCPSCNGLIQSGYICIGCGFDPGYRGA